MNISTSSFKIVSVALSATLFLEVVGYIVLAMLDRTIPSGLEQITTANLTGLLGLLVKGESSNNSGHQVGDGQPKLF